MPHQASAPSFAVISGAGVHRAFDEVGVHDVAAEHAAGFRSHLEQSGATGRITVHEDRAGDLHVVDGFFHELRRYG